MEAERNKNIVKYLIRECPIGHIKEILENIKSLISPSILEEEDIQEELKKYEEAHFRQISLKDDKIILSQYNKDSDNNYYDQMSNIKIKIQPLNENIDKITELTEEEKANIEFK